MNRESAGAQRPQNVYDDPVFFEGYKKLRRNDTGLNGALEVPALHALLPCLSGKSILDLGCGFGDFARYARSEGAQWVTAVDVSEKMISEAKRLTRDDQITYMRCSIEDYAPDAESFEIVVSSMALHYISDYAAVVRQVFFGLVPGGKFVFSVEHPTCTANPIGWHRDSDGTALHWPLDRYQDEGERQTSWFVEGVTKYHRTVESYVMPLLTEGFRLDHLKEPKPLLSFLDARPELGETLRRPPVLMLSATKPA